MPRILAFAVDSPLRDVLDEYVGQEGTYVSTPDGFDEVVELVRANEADAVLVGAEPDGLDDAACAAFRQALEANPPRVLILPSSLFDAVFGSLDEVTLPTAIHDLAEIAPDELRTVLDQELASAPSILSVAQLRGVDSESYVAMSTGDVASTASGIIVQSRRHVLYVGEADRLYERLEEEARLRNADLSRYAPATGAGIGVGHPPVDLIVVGLPQRGVEPRHLLRAVRGRQSLGRVPVVFVVRKDSPTGYAPLAGLEGVHLAHESGPIDAIIDPMDEPPVIAARDTLVVLCADPARVRFLEASLADEPVELVIALRADQAAALLDEHGADLCLVDAASPVDPVAAIQTMRAPGPVSARGFIALVRGGLDARREALEAGYDAVLVDPVLPDELRGVVRMVEALTALGRRRADWDELTGVRSELALADALDELLSENIVQETRLFFIGIEVDGLDTIAERFGTRACDRVLRALADALSEAFGGRDFVFRADRQFYVLQRGRSSQWAAVEAIVERTLDAFGRQTFRAPDGRGYWASATAGAILVPPVDVSADLCIDRCRLVLRRSRLAGVDRLLVAQLDPDAIASVRQPADRSDRSDRSDGD